MRSNKLEIVPFPFDLCEKSGVLVDMSYFACFGVPLSPHTA